MNYEITKNKKQTIKRIIDSIITDGILSIFENGAEDIAKEVCDKLKDSDFVEYYYLKGGNAINKLLEGANSGDWDFQVIPKEGMDYDNYIIEQLSEHKLQLDNYIQDKNEIEVKIDNAFVEKIMSDNIIFSQRIEHRNTLKRYIKNFKKLITGEKIKKDENLYGEEEDMILKLNIQEFISGFIPAVAKIALKENLGDDIEVKYRENKSCQYQIGKEFCFKKEWEVYTSELFDSSQNRIDLSLEQIDIEVFDDHEYKEYFYPSVLVNYTIPGFLLYRLCLNYSYDLEDNVHNKTEKINFKSEVVDISIPRQGSAEALLSTKLDIFEKDSFSIPGWRYHMFENIMLISEANYGVSGSPHKIKKRKKRANQSIKELLNLNQEDTYALCWNERLVDKCLEKNKSYFCQLMDDLKADNEHIRYEELKEILQLRSDVELNKENNPSTYLAELDKHFLVQVKISEIITTLKSVLLQKYSITGVEAQTFDIYLDAISSSAYHISQSDKIPYPLGFVSLKVDDSTFLELSSKHMGENDKIKSIEKKDEIIEIKLNTQKTGTTKTVTSLVEVSKIDDMQEYTSSIEELIPTKSVNHKLNIHLLDKDVCKNEIEHFLSKIHIFNIRKPLIDIYKEIQSMR